MQFGGIDVTGWLVGVVLVAGAPAVAASPPVAASPQPIHWQPTPPPTVPVVQLVDPGNEIDVVQHVVRRPSLVVLSIVVDGVAPDAGLAARRAEAAAAALAQTLLAAGVDTRQLVATHRFVNRGAYAVEGAREIRFLAPGSIDDRRVFTLSLPRDRLRAAQAALWRLDVHSAPALPWGVGALDTPSLEQVMRQAARLARNAAQPGSLIGVGVAPTLAQSDDDDEWEDTVVTVRYAVRRRDRP